MKFLVALLLLVLTFYLVGFFLPQTYTVTRTQTIQASPERVHAAVNDLHTWAEWSAFKLPAKEGVTTESEYQGPRAGVGAIWRWSGLGDIKPAQLEIVGSDPAQGIEYTLSMDGGRVKTTGAIEYAPAGDGVAVTMINRGEMATPWSRYFTFLADKSIGPTFEQSLQGLQTYLDADPVEASNGGAASGPDSAPGEGAPEAADGAESAD